MANKTLNTRIQLKNASLSQWNSSDVQLLAGEVALARIDTQKQDEWGNITTVPTYLMKVGVGGKTFSQLNWLAAPASDVHEWAKKETLQYADLPATLQTEIDALQEAVGTGGSVDTKINAAISALKEACKLADAAVENQFVTAVAQEDGKIAVTRRALTAGDIPALAISKITGLQDALNLKASTYSVQTLQEKVEGTDGAGGLVKAIADEETARKAADKTLTDAVNLINSTTIPNLSNSLTVEINNAKYDASVADAKAQTAQDEVDALEGVVGNLTTTVENNRVAAANAMTDEIAARTSADEALQNAVDALSESIGNLSNIMNFRGVISHTYQDTAEGEKEYRSVEEAIAGTYPPVNETDFNSFNAFIGDVVIFKDKEYVFVERDGTEEWVEFGDATGNAAAITALEARVGTAEGKITALETDRVTESELAAATSALQDQIDTKAAQTALNSTNDRVTALEGAVGDDSKGLVKDVADLKTTVGDANSGLVKKVAALESASANHATKAELESAEGTLSKSITDETTARQNADTALGQRIDAIVNTTIPSAVERIADNEEAIGNLQTAVNTINNTTIPTLATNKDLDDAKARIKAIEEGDYLMESDQFIINCGDHTNNFQ